MNLESEGFDSKVPIFLKNLQLWFGESLICPHIDKAASEYILGNKFLGPEQRLNLYRGQFWVRILKSLRNMSPLLYAWLGSVDFDRLISVPYLLFSLPRHWSLDFVADRLPEWIEEQYQEEDKQFIWNVARLDRGYTTCFFAAHFPLIIEEKSSTEEDIFKEHLCLQPHLQLFCFDYDLFSFRDQVLQKEASDHYFYELPFTDQERYYYFVLYRNRTNQAVYQEILPLAFEILKQFREGSSLNEVIDWIANQDADVMQEAEKHLQGWIEEWVGKEWLYRKTERGIKPRVSKKA